MALVTTLQQLQQRPLNKRLLARFYQQLIAYIPCRSSGVQCQLVRLAIASIGSEGARLQSLLRQMLQLIESKNESSSGLDHATTQCNLEVLRLRVNECLWWQ